MSKILTYSEYQDFPTGKDISESEFDTLSFYAETAIFAYIGRDAAIDETVKQAAALQIAFSIANGGVDYYNKLSVYSDVTSESLSDYSYSKSVVSNCKEQSEYGLFPIVAKMLGSGRVEGVNVIL